MKSLKLWSAVAAACLMFATPEALRAAGGGGAGGGGAGGGGGAAAGGGAGNAGAAAGNSGAAAGNGGAAAGNGGAAAGNRGAAAGNTGAAAGNTGAAAGNTGASTGNTGAAAGNNGATAGNSGASTGNSGAKSGVAPAQGNTGATVGNSGATTGNRGATVGDAGARSGVTPANGNTGATGQMPAATPAQGGTTGGTNAGTTGGTTPNNGTNTALPASGSAPIRGVAPITHPVNPNATGQNVANPAAVNNANGPAAAGNNNSGRLSVPNRLTMPGTSVPVGGSNVINTSSFGYVPWLGGYSYGYGNYGGIWDGFNSGYYGGGTSDVFHNDTVITPPNDPASNGASGGTASSGTGTIDPNTGGITVAQPGAPMPVNARGRLEASPAFAAANEEMLKAQAAYDAVAERVRANVRRSSTYMELQARREWATDQVEALQAVHGIGPTADVASTTSGRTTETSTTTGTPAAPAVRPPTTTPSDITRVATNKLSIGTELTRMETEALMKDPDALVAKRRLDSAVARLNALKQQADANAP